MMKRRYSPPKRRRERIYKKRTSRFASFTKDYILSITKIVNENGCWISDHKPKDNEYINITINGNKYYLHRIVLCLWYNVNYYDINTLALHKCNNKPCFNPEHIKPGSKSENAYDSVKAGTHHIAGRESCSKCGSPYRKRVNGKEVKKKVCHYCNNKRRREERRAKKENESIQSI